MQDVKRGYLQSTVTTLFTVNLLYDFTPNAVERRYVT